MDQRLSAALSILIAVVAVTAFSDRTSAKIYKY